MRKFTLFVGWTVYGLLLLGSLTATAAGLPVLGVALGFTNLFVVLYLIYIGAL